MPAFRGRGDAASLRARSVGLPVPSSRVELEHHLAPLKAEEHAIWQRYLKLVEAAGPSEMVVTKSRIASFSARRILRMKVC